MLPHLAYIEALAETDETTPRWPALTAGYAAMQLVDAWMGREGSVPLDAVQLRRVRKWLARMSDGDPVRRCLGQLVDVVERASEEVADASSDLRGHAVGRVLAAYGKLLQYEGSWSLARDVHETLVWLGRIMDDTERVLESMLMVGFSLRMLGQFDEAREAYDRLRDAASEAHSEQYLLLAELGFAKIAIERGNLPAAAGMLDRILVDARSGEHDSVRAKALMDRARVADQMGDYAAAAVLGFEALECTTDPLDRDRLLVNIGMTLANLGLRDQARDAFILVSATAQEATMRSLATINLMEIAYLDGRELVFEQYRRMVQGADLPPYLQAVYQEAVANGARAFGRRKEAMLAFNSMREIGERFGLNEFTLRADSALAQLTGRLASPTLPASSRVDEQPAEVAAVAHAITAMRVRVGLSD
jgi:tetratricopeptide (TPR) repeat protein